MAIIDQFHFTGNVYRNTATDEIGIGTQSPDSKLVVNYNAVDLPDTPAAGDTILHIGAADATVGRLLIDTFGSTPNVTFRRSNGTCASPTQLLANDVIFSLGSMGFYDGTPDAYCTGGRLAITGYAGENWTDVAQGTYMVFWTTPTSSVTLTERMRITAAGHIGIGTGAPGVQTYAGFTNLTLSGSTAAGLLELISQAADADNVNLGSVRWTDKNSSAADKTAGVVQCNLSGSTANNRGSRMVFYTKADGGSIYERIRIDNAGLVGIGTTAPVVALEVVNSTSSLAQIKIANTYTSSSTQGGIFTAYSLDGAAMAAGDRLGAIVFGGSRDSSNNLINSASVEGFAETLWVDGSTYASFLAFYTTDPSQMTRTEKMRITGYGNVGIGTTTFDASATNCLAIVNGAGPSAHTDDQIYISSEDSADSTASLALYLEQAVEDIGTFTASHKIKIKINGTWYWIQLDAV